MLIWPKKLGLLIRLLCGLSNKKPFKKGDVAFQEVLLGRF